MNVQLGNEQAVQDAQQPGESAPGLGSRLNPILSSSFLQIYTLASSRRCFSSWVLATKGGTCIQSLAFEFGLTQPQPLQMFAE